MLKGALRSIGARLTTGFLLIAVLALGMGLIGLVQINKVNKTLSDETTRRAETRYLSAKIRIECLQVSNLVESHVGEISLAARMRIETLFVDQTYILNEFVSQMEKRISGSNGLAEINLSDEETAQRSETREGEHDKWFEVSSLISDYLEKAQTVLLSTGDEEGDIESTQIAIKQFESARAQLLEELIELEDLETSLLYISHRTARDTVSRARVLMIGLGIAALVGGVLLGGVVSSTIKRPVERLVEAAERIAAGDLEHQAEVHSQDEIGTLAGAFNEMAVQLRGLVVNLEQRVSELRQTQEELRQSKEHYQGLFHGIPVGLYRTTPAGLIVDANLALVEMLGYPDLETLLSVNANDIYSDPHEREREQALLAEKGHVSDFDIQLVKRDGTLIWIRDNVRAVRDHQGHVLWNEGSLRDITRRKEAEEALRRAEEETRQRNQELEMIYRIGQTFSSTLEMDRVLEIVLGEVRSLFQISACSIWFVDPATGEVVLQQATDPRSDAVKGWRLAPGEGIVSSVAESGISLIVPDVLKDTRHFAGVAERTGLITRSLLSVPLKVKERVIGVLQMVDEAPDRFDETHLTLLESVATAAATAIENARLYEQVQSYATDLEERVSERTAELAAANEELEAFAYSVSHDLRAPLRSMDGFSQAVLEDHSESLEPVAQDYLRRVRAASQRMGQLIDDLLKLSRVARREMRRETVDLTALAQLVADDLRQRTSQRDIEFRIAPGLIAHGDARLLRVVLENLLDNACKFTSKQPHARIEFGCIEKDEELQYYVRDNGVGFEMGFDEKLFGPFQRLHTASEFDGTGIGLATAQRVVQRHGGQIWAEGAVNGGATFYFTLSPHLEKANET